MRIEDIVSKDPRSTGDRMRGSRDFAEGYILGQLGTVTALILLIDHLPASAEQRRRIVENLRQMGKGFEFNFDEETATAPWRAKGGGR